MYTKYYSNKGKDNNGKFKIFHIKIGKSAQVNPDNIPLITDILDNPESHWHDKNVRHD